MNVPRNIKPARIYHADCIFVHDEIDPFDGRVLRHVYCFKKQGDQIKITGVIASYVENFKITEGEVTNVRYQDVTFRSTRYLYVKSVKADVEAFLKQFEWTNPMWIGQ